MPTAATRPCLVFGEVLLDHYPNGQQVLGGAAFNVAWNLAGMGLDPTLVTAFSEPSQIAWELESWTWLSASLAPAGAGTILVFDNTVDTDSITPNTTDNAVSGFIAQSDTYAASSYDFASPLLLDELTEYVVLTDSIVGHSRFNTGDYTDGNRFVGTGSGDNPWITSNNGDSNFRAELTAVVPEPASITLVVLGCVVVGRRRVV